MMSNIRRSLTALTLGAFLFIPLLAQAFTISDIKVEGLRTITPGAVFTYIPYQVGDSFDATDSTRVVEALYKTGFFSNVVVGRKGDALMIKVKERPTITGIKVTGNKKVETKKLQKALRGIGLTQGHVLDPQALDKMKTELQRVYYSMGQYGVQIKTKVQKLDDNRVFVNINIFEGKPASIRSIHIVGNKAFSESELLDQFKLGAVPWWKFWSSADQYSKQKLATDLESLRSFYLDRGYLKFAIDSTQVTITPDRKQIEIVINISEGDRYKVSGVSYSGNMLLSDAELKKLTQVEDGKYFNREEVVNTSDAITKRLGDDGYAFAQAQPMPTINDKNKTAKIDFRIRPGQRVTVRQIHFSGNFNTNEEVYRREMRQMEGSWYAANKLDRSKERLQRLPSVQKVDQKLKPVPGHPDQVDVNYDITEQLSGSFTAGVGYSQSEGVLFNVGMNQPNFFGTGKSVGINLERSSYRTAVRLNYNNPYFTVNGISQGFGVFYSKQNASKVSVSRYLMDNFGGNINFGVPLSEYTFASVAFQLQRQTIKSTSYSPSWVADFDNQSFNTFSIQPSWKYDSRNKAIFPTAGQYHKLSASVSVPGSDLLYYQGEYQGKVYLPLWKDVTLSGHGDVALAQAYGSTKSKYSGTSPYYDSLPPFLNYYTGGINSVRGYRDYSLGPVDSNGDPLGGTFKVVGGLELITPIPFLTKQADSVRMAAFWDIGNVYRSYNDFSAQGLRQSVGVSVNWYSPVGPLIFSLAKPLNAKPGDHKQVFQFSVGASF